jgi:peptidoglycan L-alanyl-D-glutamate endopeptidase CwlK
VRRRVCNQTLRGNAMMPWWIALYFIGACALVAWLSLPAARALAWRQLVGLANLARARNRVARSRRRMTGRARGGLAAAVLACVAGPVWMLWLGAPSLPAVDEPRRGGDALVSALLQGEHLVPPPPLPPALFLTPEVQAARPGLAMADRRWAQFQPAFRQRLLLVYQRMKDQHGYEMVLLEGYRSPERQAALSTLGPNVTNAGAWQSYHQYGLAADSAFMRGGKLVISERDPWARRGYALYGQLAEQAGLVWGGRWQNADLGHVELRSGGQGPANP